MTDETRFPEFPADFLWGASTSAYQIEGAVAEDGRAPSTWDTFCARPGAIVDGSDGAVACDHYHRYPQDVALMKDLGLGAYSFSVSWSRVRPTGSGPVNAAGLDFYDRLVDELCAAGVRPLATLFHWDTPQPLEDAGGWLNRDITERFAEYATIVGERLADRVAMWATINEPQIFTLLGYATGAHAPGRSLAFESLPVAHHQLLAHGMAVRALRAAGAHDIGLASNHTPVWPASGAEADRTAADAYNLLYNWMFADPILTGEYPNGIGDGMPGPVADDLAVMSSPLDWFGLNYYTPSLVGAPSEGAAHDRPVTGLDLPPGLPFELRRVEGYPTTGFGWPVVPDGLREMLVTLHDRYGEKLPPVYITENGCSYADAPNRAGHVNDPDRIAFLDGHLRAVRAAMDAGVDVRGYFTWSIMDNFEWAEGYTQRFGLVHVDYATQRRTPKDSYAWYRDVIAGRRRAPEHRSEARSGGSPESAQNDGRR